MTNIIRRNAGIGEAGVFFPFTQGRVIDDWLMPSLTRLGEAWGSGEIDVAAEHFVTNIIRRNAGIGEETNRQSLAVAKEPEQQVFSVNAY